MATNTTTHTRIKPPEATLAFTIGILLPILETARRRTNFDESPLYIDDYIALACLALAHRSARHPETRHAP